ncbi:MAG: hypothetical protein IKG47_00340 [Oscillospiraceae bacterium]|nr:hypothetical protein [Clostridiales bacterium]MBR3353793.1 hypothetical protein [Oscillospiraceae bacterium]
MSVLIEGMEMPKKGSWISLRVFPDGQCFLYSWCGNDFDFMEHLTASPVPPHGRLIDADKNTFPTPHRNPSNDYMKGWNACLHSVQQQPTVIPAEEKT